MKNSAVRSVMTVACALFAGAAQADFVGALGPITAPASMAFTNSTGSQLSFHVGPPALAAPYNFLDQWTFTLTGSANVTSLVAAFKFDDGLGGLATFGVDNIQVNLFDVANSAVAVGWQTVSANSPFTTTVSMTPPTGLVPGAYTLQVRGTLLGVPGAYSGSLIAAAPSPAPLPAALPLLALGLGAIGVAGAGRRKPKRADRLAREA